MTQESCAPRRLVCFGDSITAAKMQPENCRWTVLVQAALESKHPGIWQVFNRGVAGETVRCGLDRFERDIAPLLPATVLIEFGINDSSFRDGRRIPRVGIVEFEIALREILRLVRAQDGDPILLTNHALRPPETDGEHSPAEKLSGYQNAIRNVALSDHCGLIDLEKEFVRTPTHDHLVEDGVHLSRAGNARYARAVLNGLISIGVL